MRGAARRFWFQIPNELPSKTGRRRRSFATLDGALASARRVLAVGASLYRVRTVILVCEDLVGRAAVSLDGVQMLDEREQRERCEQTRT